MNYLIARVSDPEQRKALPAQRQKLYDYADKQQWVEKKDFIYVEFDETAYKDNRKRFREKVVEPLLKSTTTAICCFDKIDRYSRDSSGEEKAILTKLFRQGKIELHFPSDNLFIHKNSPAADLFRLDIGVALAGYYSSAIRDNVMRRFNQKLRDGEWPGKSPIGYLNYVKGKDARGNDIRDIKPDPERAHHILKGFELRSTGLSYRAIAKDRKRAGLKSNTKLLKPITTGQWEEILLNPFYYGKMRYMGNLYPHKYGEIVPQWLWDRCQEVKVQRSKNKTQYNKKQYLFKNIKCAKCGYSVTFDGPKYNGLTYGKCTEWGGKHGAKWIDERVLIDQVTAALKSFQVPKRLLPGLITEIERIHESEQEYYVGRRNQLVKEHKDLDDQVKSLFRERNKFELRPELFEEMVKEAETKQKAILQELEGHGKADKAFVIGASFIIDVASRGVELFTSERSKLPQKRYLLNFVFSNIEMEGDRLLFTLKGPFQSLAMFHKSQSWLRGLDSNQRPRR